MPRALPLICALVATLVVAAVAHGATDAPAPACPAGNLLAGRRPVAWSDIIGLQSLPTDGSVANEGAAWDSFPAARLATGAGELVYDLGEPFELHLAYMQADANDSYSLFGSIDGNSFAPIGVLEPVTGPRGLRSRTVDLHGAVARYVRIADPRGDKFYSISEVQLFCRTPVPFPPPLRVLLAPTSTASRGLRWDDVTSARFELLLALVGLLVVGSGGWLASRGDALERHPVRNTLLALLGAVSAAAYVNFGAFHFPNFVHAWDTFHYYVGAKYHRELGYERLYECVAIADAEAGLRRRVELRTLTNLHTNVIEHSGDVLAHPERCKQHFTAERWRSFAADVAFFRARMSPKFWEDLQMDHGYNASPVWTLAGTVLANTGPATETQIRLLTAIDCGLLLAAAAMIAWAFGWRALSVALLVFATNFPSRWYWTGGCFLRQDWLFLTLAGTCLAKKGRSMLGGFALGYAALLRVFPVFVFVGPMLAAVEQLRARRRIEKPYRRIFVGGALAVALLVPLSLVTADAPGIYARFAANTIKHARTPLTNNMGLPTLLSYRPSEVGRHLRSDRLIDPWSEWKAARLAAFERSRILFAALLLGLAALIARAVRGRELWVSLAVGAAAIPFCAELTCYYYSFLAVVALLASERGAVAPLLLSITLVTQLVAAWGGWTDEQSTIMSFATLLGLTGVMACFAFARDRLPRSAVAPVETLACPEPGAAATRSS